MLSKLVENHSKIIIFLIIISSLIIRFLCTSYNEMLVEEAYYWNFSQHMDFSYLDHPPMVAFLIKLSTLVFGESEFGIRLSTLICWGFTCFFSFRLTKLVNQEAAIYTILLLSILPFFFLQSLMITPDSPLLICWAAMLYYLYRALILNESFCWYAAGMWLGLGMLSKYTIILLVPTTFFYLCAIPKAYRWFYRKEIYLSALIALLIFTPVLYWNATHDWVSFIFQGTRRLKSVSHFHLHQFIGLLVLFLLPIGIVGLWKLCSHKTSSVLENKVARFFQLYFLIPLIVFALFSFNHNVKFNWIGPTLLAIVPWLANLCVQNNKTLHNWFLTAVILLISYISVMFVVKLDTTEKIQQTFFKKFTDWNKLTTDFYNLAQAIEEETHKKPVFVTLDNYPIASELSFYQTKLFNQDKINKIYPIIGAHIFGGESLMYRYWSNINDFTNTTLIVISTEPWQFNTRKYKSRVIDESNLKQLWAYNQGQGIKLIPYYYKIVTKNNITLSHLKKNN